MEFLEDVITCIFILVCILVGHIIKTKFACKVYASRVVTIFVVQLSCRNAYDLVQSLLLISVNHASFPTSCIFLESWFIFFVGLGGSF